MAADNKTVWQKAMRGSKMGFDRLWGYADKLGAPVNKLTNKIGSEAFWPTSIDKESYKAARILRSFCKDGIYTDEPYQIKDGPTATQKVLKKIPAQVIKNAKGLAIFTTMRSGLWFSGAGGAGVVIARLPDGSWSPPSGILLHTAGIGFLVGVDIYDCVLVLNTDEAVQAFSRWRATVGGEISAVAGPVGVGGILETELHKRQAPIFTYLRSRGFYAGVQIDGTVIIERNDENEKFYGHKYSAQEILAGKVHHPPYELHMLMETLKAAQGDADVDESALPTEPPPADFDVVKSDHVFGVPDREDPDPFGVLALEKEGLAIKEAGSQMIPAHDEFDFKPALTSPVYTTYNKAGSTRDSMESSTNRNSWRSSALSIDSVGRPKYVTMDTSTQTDLPSPPLSQAPGTPKLASTPEHEAENEPLASAESSTVTAGTQERKLPPPLPLRVAASRHVPPPLPLRVNVKPGYASASTSTSSPAPVREAVASIKPAKPVADTEAITSPEDEEKLEEDDEDEDDDDEEPVEVVEVQQVQARPIQAMRPQVISAGSGPRVVTVGPRARPPVPSRNPSRAVRPGSMSQGGGALEDLDGASAESATGSASSVSPTSPERERKESVTSPEGSPTVSIRAKSPSVKSTRSVKSTLSAAPEPHTEAAAEPTVAGSSNTRSILERLTGHVEEGTNHSTTAAPTHETESGMPGGFPTIEEQAPTPPELDTDFLTPSENHDAEQTFSNSPVDPKNRISMANLRLGLGQFDDDDDARSPSPTPKVAAFTPIQSPIDGDAQSGMEFA